MATTRLPRTRWYDSLQWLALVVFLLWWFAGAILVGNPDRWSFVPTSTQPPAATEHQVD